MRELDPAVRRLLHTQSGIVARRQLNAVGLDWDAAQTHVEAGRWVAQTPRVLSSVTGTLTVEQRRWVGVLHAGPRSMLGGLTAAAHHGLIRWERRDVTVLVDDELSFESVPGVRFFRSRRPFDLMISPRSGIATARIEPALLLWAAYSAAPRPALGVLAAAVQQGRTTPQLLLDWVEQLRPLRRARLFRSALGDIEGGAHSGAELDVNTMCRVCSLPRPQRQTSRLDSHGRRRWTDCEWPLPGGRTLVLEVDGAFHRDVESWTEDLVRHRRLVTVERLIVRCTSDELRLDPGGVGRDLVALGLVPLTEATGGDQRDGGGEESDQGNPGDEGDGDGSCAS